MRHCIPDPEAQSQRSGGYLTIYSCEYDDGRRASHEFVRLGDDGKVMFLLCESCKAQMIAQVLAPLVLEAVKHKVMDGVYFVEQVDGSHIRLRWDG